MPEIAPFWLSCFGVLSPGTVPPQVWPPSVERIRTICWAGTIVLESKLQQTYIVPILWSCGRFGPPLTSVWLSTAIQFLSSSSSSWVSPLRWLSWTTIGPLQRLCGRLMFTVMLKPVKASVPPGASSVFE